MEVLAQQGMVLALGSYIDQDLSVVGNAGPDSIIVAIAYGHLEVAELLLNRISAVVGQSGIQTALDEALIFAAKENDLAAMRMLLGRGAGAGSGLALIAAVASCAADTARVLLAYHPDASLPYYEGEHVASFARRCVIPATGDEDAVRRFSAILRLLYEADASICPFLVSTPGDESPDVTAVLQDLGLCQ